MGEQGAPREQTLRELTGPDLGDYRSEMNAIALPRRGNYYVRLEVYSGEGKAGAGALTNPIWITAKR